MRAMAALLLAGACALAGAEEPGKVILAYFERPPYYYSAGGLPKGFLLERAQLILERAKVPFELRELPSMRIAALIREGSQPIVSVGWFKTAERLAYSRFSDPIYRNRPQGILVRAARAGEFKNLPTFAALSSSPRFTLGAVEGFSYGVWFDPILAGMSKRVQYLNSDPVHLAAMLGAGRFDYMVLDREEVDWVIETAGLRRADFSVVEYPDIPEGNLRYLWCSPSVGEEVLQRINEAVKTLFPDLS